MNFLLSRCIAGRGVVARESRQILAEAVAGRKAVRSRLVDVLDRSPAIPPSHFFSGSRQAGALPKRLEQRVFVQSAIERVIAIELFTCQPLQQLHIRVAKLAQWRSDAQRL